jgi:amidase
MFEKPTVADLREAAQKLGMNPSDDYLKAVEQIITPLANAYAVLDTTPDELPPVKYPRGHSIGRRWRRTRTAPGI